MRTELSNSTRSWWKRWRLPFLVLALILCVAVFASRWLPRKCNHDTTVEGLIRYRSSIDLSRANSKERAFFQAVIDGQVLGEDKAKFQDILPEPRWFDVSEETESLTYFVPNNHKGISKYSELWLTVDIELECGHVDGAKFWDRPVH